MIKRAAKKLYQDSVSMFSDLKATKKLSTLKDGDYFVDGDVPYQCQFASPELVKDILEKKLSATDDPKWKDFGYKTKKDYEFWSLRLCGIASLKMILDYYKLTNNKKVAELTNEGVELGGYVIYDNKGNLEDKGWFYKPLVELGKKYGLKGYSSSYLSANHLCSLIFTNKLVIASVNPCIIRFDKLKGSESPGGHLVVVFGFKIKDGRLVGFYINNPSGKKDETRVKVYIPINTFKNAFDKKGMVFWKQEK
ncbi:MAG: hypothetical protein UT66_C0017G0007 [candidate division CPR2 bacterium GW2011_GWC1_39_9]|uniref:Peptidase C39-like domain-containing protein n=1 Tax=candidate division CPR2 bacterium GW2011_GWC2_39_10 TaxID=1618345 RepID=A0A0G0P8H9_UNCC2|nr:MAG: hypothetical protein UT18_C0010G0016 [candidate division CPR2 bacterium GW2011_GWC2_39_10]KKR34728.1 MAG: hypothetical protein UT66_C0017G0007 [candidate division CPR2 bacterium GW2011_GWC1_39_9]